MSRREQTGNMCLQINMVVGWAKISDKHETPPPQTMLITMYKSLLYIVVLFTSWLRDHHYAPPSWPSRQADPALWQDWSSWININTAEGQRLTSAGMDPIWLNYYKYFRAVHSDMAYLAGSGSDFDPLPILRWVAVMRHICCHSDTAASQTVLPTQHRMFSQCCYDVGPPS